MLNELESKEWQRLRAIESRLTDRGRARLAELDAKTLPETSVGGRALIGLGRGMLDIFEGVGQKGRQAGEALGLLDPGTAQAYTDTKAADLAEYEKLAAAHPYSTGAGRLAGNIAAAPIPGLGASTGARVASAGLLGAGVGATEFAPGMSSGEALRGAMFGGGGGAMGEGLGALVDALYRVVVPHLLRWLETYLSRPGVSSGGKLALGLAQLFHHLHRTQRERLRVTVSPSPQGKPAVTLTSRALSSGSSTEPWVTPRSGISQGSRPTSKP